MKSDNFCAPPPLLSLQRGSQFYGTFDFDEEVFDWGADYKRPAVPASEYVVYEVPLRPFTASASSGVAEERRGTYLGFMDKVPTLSPLPPFLSPSRTALVQL